MADLSKMNELRKFAPLVKVEQRKDAPPIVWFRIASETPDSANEICDYEHSKPHFMKHSAYVDKLSKGKSKFNVREQHGGTAAGRAPEFIARDAEKDFLAGVEIVDPVTAEKFEKGVLNGASIGGSYGPWSMKDGAYKRYEAVPVEFSLVDIPSNSDALPIDMPAEFEFVRVDGTKELRKFLKDGEPMAEIKDTGANSATLTVNPNGTDTTIVDPIDELILQADQPTLKAYLEKLQKAIQPEELQKAEPAPAAAEAKDDGGAATEPEPVNGGEAAVPSQDDLRALILGILEELGLVVKEGEAMKAVAVQDLTKSAEALDLVKADFAKQTGELSKAISDGDKALAGDIAKLVVETEKIEDLSKRVEKVTGMGPVIMVPGADPAQASVDHEVEVLKKYLESTTDPAQQDALRKAITVAEIKQVHNSK